MPFNSTTRAVRRAVSPALATLLAAAVLLPLLGHKPLTDWDEGIYAEVAREMLSFGGLTPHWNFQPWFEKPPLAMGLTAVLFRLFGVSEFTARAVSALSGVATVTLLHAWLARSRDLLTAWLSTAILLGTFGFLHACHVGETDTLLALACTLALIGLAKLDEPSPGGWYLFWIGFALALMTKGAASVTLPLTACLFAVIKRPHLGKPFSLGLLVFLVLVLPWHLAMLHRWGRPFLNEYLGFHVLTRATHQIEGHATPWYFYLKVLLVSAPPFVLLYPAAMARAIRKSRSTEHRVISASGSDQRSNSCLQPFALFALVTLTLYSLVQTRLPQYIVPIYPALTVLTAVFLADRLQPLLAPRRAAAFWIKLTLATAAISVASILVTTPARKSLHSATLADGTTRADNKDSTALLRQAFHNPQPILRNTPGPLLLWRQGPISSIATDVFYARRPVQQVALAPSPSGILDRYTFNPQTLAEAVTTEPRLILLDRNLIPQLPATFAYTPIQASGSMELGTIRLGTIQPGPIARKHSASEP